jgi:acyl-CoA synthetase (AMP-forming)/AMP-acid ligase II
MNIAVLLEMAADAMGDRVGVGSAETGLTYAALLDHARGVAALIAATGAERVGLVDTNSHSVPVSLFASAIAGTPFAPLNYRLADDRLNAALERISPALVIAGSDTAGRLKPVPNVTILATVELEKPVCELAIADETPIDPDAVAVWLFTSGTTGEPKIAFLRHRHLVAYVLSAVDFMHAAEHEAALVSVPPYHIAGIASVLSNVYAGRRIVYLPQFDPEEWVELARRERVSHAMVVPTMLGRILDVVDKRGATLPDLTHLSYGGGRMPVSIVERALDLLPHVDFVNAYGLTETSSTIAVLGPEDHRVARGSNDPVVRRRLGSVGRPLPTLELQIHDPFGEPLPAGETGEICVRGEQIAGEYHGRHALSSDGWFRTNDGGHLDEDGYLFVDGRLDDVIVRGGENISPGEIEDVLISHPAVAQAAVTGIPDSEWGETIAAAVVLASGATANEAELQAWVRERLRSSRMPAVVEIRSSLPYNDTGKLLRRVLRDELANALERETGATA